MLAIFIPAFLSHTACDSLFPLRNGHGPVGSSHRPPAPEHAPRSSCEPTAPPAPLHAAPTPHLARMPHDAHLSPVNSYDPGRDPAIGPLADAAVGPDSGSLVAAAGSATGLEPPFPLRGEPHIATIVGPADVSTGGGPLALAATAVAGAGSYAGGSAFIVGLTPMALDGQPLPRPQGTTSRISACGSAGAASAVKAPTCDIGSRAASLFHHGLLVTSVACLGGSDRVARQPVCQQPAAPSPHPAALLDYSEGGEAGAGSRLDPTIARGGCASPRLPGLFVTGGNSLDGPICAASRPVDGNSFIRLFIGDVRIGSHPYALPPSRSSGGRPPRRFA